MTAASCSPVTPDGYTAAVPLQESRNLLAVEQAEESVQLVLVRRH